jgi:hypothetical protein
MPRAIPREGFVTRRLPLLLFIVGYVALSVHVSSERILLWTDWIDDAIGVDKIAVKAPKSSDVLAYPRFSHAQKINRNFEFDLPRQISAPQLVVVGYHVELRKEHASWVSRRTGASRSPPADLAG